MAYSDIGMNSLLGCLVNEYGKKLFKKKQKVRMKVYLEDRLYPTGSEYSCVEGTYYIKYIKYDINKKVFKFITTEGIKIKLPFRAIGISVEFDY